MTLVAALCNTAETILIADSRLTFRKGAERDVCQKVVRLGNEGLVGFASNNVEIAHQILGLISETYEVDGLSWLKSEKQVNELFDLAGAQRDDPNTQTQLLITFTDRDHEPMQGVPGSLVVKVDSSTRQFKRSYFGLHMIGSGRAVQPEIEKEPGRIELLNFATGMEPTRALILRSLFFSQVLVETADRLKVPGVGGLFQIYWTTANGVFAIPYERWVDIGEHEGTYVQMTIDDEGRWVQKHVPTGLSITLGMPYQDDGVVDSPSQDLKFELQDLLGSGAPGVVRKENPLVVYRPIDGEYILRTP